MTHQSINQPLPAKLFATIVEHTPLISIDLIVRNENGEVLLGERLNAPAKGYWFTPGGRIYKNETLAQAFERITQAELGHSYLITDANFLGTFEHFYDDSFVDEQISTHYVVLAYSLSLPTNHNSFPTNDQHNTYRWQSIEVLLVDPTVHTHVKWYFR